MTRRMAVSSSTAKRRFAICWVSSDVRLFRRHCNCASMRRKPLFPPVENATGAPQEDKGRSGHGILTVNGHVRINRRHYYCASQGTSTPSDAMLDALEATVSLGVREMAARVNAQGKSFDRAA